ncbi:MAG: tetratricopeptide repeat protein [Acidobacteriaceae bacterium]|nr:tetratricopeptide repeat protein [Acidobacteriaceae bacterium]
MTIVQSLNLALSHHGAGRLAEAEGLYRQILAVDPEQPDALHWLGFLAHQAGHGEAALQLMTRSLSRAPHIANYHNNLGQVLATQKRNAAPAFRNAIILSPELPEAYINLAQRLSRDGQVGAALVLLDQAAYLSPDVADIYNAQGLVWKQRGDFARAAMRYRQALERDPCHAAAVNNLGAVLLRQQQRRAATAAFRHAIVVGPMQAEGYLNLAEIMAPRDCAQAMALCRRALTLRHDLAAVSVTVARLAARNQTLAAATAWLTQALILTPAAPGILSAWAQQALSKSQTEKATSWARRACHLNPCHLDALVSLGQSLERSGKAEKAERCLVSALIQDPSSPAIVVLGAVLRQTKRKSEALAWSSRGCRVNPDDDRARTELGLTLAELDRFDEASVAFRCVLSHKPDDAETWAALANVLMAQAEPGAVALYRRGLVIEPEHPAIRWNLALALLRHGDFTVGWANHEARLLLTGPQKIRLPELSTSIWDGQDLTGRTLLLHTEQGLGDTLQFVRYVPLVAARGGKIVLVAPRPLVNLLRSLPGVDVLIATGDPVPPFDFWLPLLSLPRVFSTTLDTIPERTPYLRADPECVATWQQRLGNGIRVGLVWAGSPGNGNDRNRSCPLELLVPLLAVPGIRWFSLQKGSRAADPARLGWQERITDLDPLIDDFADTAAIIANLDLVVSVDTSVAHLTGALGQACWVLLPFAPDWRWMLDRTDSPWYPRSRLFRQTRPGDWSAVVTAVATALAGLSSCH